MATDTVSNTRRRAPAPEERTHASRHEGQGPARAAATPAERTHEAAGNQAVQRLLGTTADRARAASGRADSPREQDAAKAADTGRAPRNAVGDAAPRAQPARRLVRDAGRPLAAPLRRSLKSRVAAPLSSVRVHTGHIAAAAASAVDARAFAVGEDIVFGEGAFAPDTREGRRLLVHELTHVVQQRRTGLAIDRQPNPGPTQADPPPAPLPADPAQTTSDVPVTIEVPMLEGERKERDETQRFMLHVKPDGDPQPVKLFAVPFSKLKLPKPDLTKPPVPTAGPIDPAAVQAAHPETAPGAVVEAIDGAKLKVVASGPEHIITAEYTKFAVGAASTSLVKLEDGTFLVIDAGINNRATGSSFEALKNATLDKMASIIKDGRIRELIASHLHADHASLAADIIGRWPIDTIRLNDVMKRWKGYEAFRKKLVEAQRARIEAAKETFRNQTQAERVAWEADKGAGFAADRRQAEWEKYVEEKLKERLPELHGAREAQERVLIQSKNVLDIAEVDLATGAKRGVEGLDPSQQKSPTFGEQDPYAIAETQAPLLGERAQDRRRKTTSKDVDPNASAYAITLKNGMTLLVLPDLRANDLQRITKRFAEAMAKVKRPVSGVQVWDATHHMQKGWYAGGVPASQLGKIADFLFEFSAKQGADVVVVSAQADLTNPNAKTLVDPANIWLLRSLGFEAYLAASGRDVRVIDVQTTQGTKVTGVIGAKAPGEGPSELTIKRTKNALAQLDAERQAQKVALKEEHDPSKRDAIEKRISEIEAIHKEIDAAYKECLAEIHQKLAAAKGTTHTTKSLTDVTKQEFPRQKALDQLLEKYNFDRPVTTDVHLTEMAIVVIGLDAPPGPPPEPGTPGARARELATVRSRVLEIEARIKAGDTSPAIGQELVTELTVYRTILNNELNPLDPAQKPIEGSSRRLLADDLKTVDQKVATLTEEHGATTYARKIGSGEIIEQHAVVVKPLKPPSEAMAKTQAALEGVGRTMGAVMIVTTVTGQGELMRRWQEGQATGAETAVGTVRNVISGAVALQMLRGVNVHPGVFVVISVLEVTEAALRHYTTEEERDIEVTYAAVSAAINLGCMGVGMAIMAIPTPVTAVVGFLITMAGPVILKAFGVHDWIERRMSFNPSAVVEVLQTLRELMTKYREVVGSLQIAKRAANEKDPTFTDREGAKEAAQKIIADESRNAWDLEQKILKEFRTAYADAMTNYAGLKDLDMYRAQFYALRQQAGVSAQEQDLKRRYPDALTADDVFKQIDATMSADDLPASAFDRQWEKLDEELRELGELVEGERGEEYHSKVREKDRRVQAMIDNARYRLNPSAMGGERLKPILSEGGKARRTYEDALSYRESSLEWLRYRYVVRTRKLADTALLPDTVDPKRPFVNQPWPMTIEWVMPMLEGSIREYRTLAEKMVGPPPELAAAMFRESADTERYRAFVKDHTEYGEVLQQLETMEQMIEGYLSQVARMVPAVKNASVESDYLNEKHAAEVKETWKEARSFRYFKRGLVFLSELDGLERQVWEQETTTIMPLFDPKEQAVPSLTPEEELALKENKGKFDSDDKVRPPLAWLLKVTRSPAEKDANGNLANIFRLAGQVQLYVPSGGGGVFPNHRSVGQSDHIMVGILAAGRRFWVYDHARNSNVEVVQVTPLNDKAIAFFGGAHMYAVAFVNLAPITASELEKLKHDQPLVPVTPAPQP